VRIWFAIIIAPALALADQSFAFALVGWACAHQTTVPIHAAHAVVLAATSAAIVLAWQEWRDTARRHFLARVAMAVAALAALSVVAMWIPTWMISPCTA
jgi:hypothetical protein